MDLLEPATDLPSAIYAERKRKENYDYWFEPIAFDPKEINQAVEEALRAHQAPPIAQKDS
jgi:hypothetical protein